MVWIMSTDEDGHMVRYNPKTGETKRLFSDEMEPLAKRWMDEGSEEALLPVLEQQAKERSQTQT